MIRSKFFSLLVSVSLLISAFPGVSHASFTNLPPSQAPPWLGLADYIPPAMTTLAVQGNIAYLGAGPSLLAFDISDPDHPQRLLYQLLPGIARQVLVFAEHVYVLVSSEPVYYPGRSDRILIYDTNRLPALQWIGEYRSTSIDSFAVDASRLYIGDPDGFSILDVRDTTQIDLLGQLPLIAATPEVTHSISEIRIQGSLAVLGIEFKFMGYTTSIELWTVDISNPELPQQIGALSMLSRANFDVITDLSIDTDFAILAKKYDYGFSYGYDSVYEVIDLSDPTQPSHIYTQLNPLRGDLAVDLAYPILYIGTPFDPISVYDLSNPAKPQSVGTKDQQVWDLAAGPEHLGHRWRFRADDL